MSLIVNNGIYQKVENDLTTSSAVRDLFDGFWTPELLRANKPLNIYHILPSFMELGLGLIISAFVLCLEVFWPQKKSGNQTLTIGSQPRPVINPDVFDPKRRGGALRIGKYSTVLGH